MIKSYNRRSFQDRFAENKLFRENRSEHRQEPFVVRELPIEKLTKYQKKLIIVVCRVFEQDGAERMIEELDKLQYCSLETALRVAREGGYLPQDTLNDMEELKMAQSLMSDEAMIEMIGLYMQRAKPSELAEKYNLDIKQVSNLIYRAKSNDKYKHLFTTIQAPVPSENDIDRAANAIDNYLAEKNLTADMNEEKEQQHPKVFTATGEGLIEAVDGMLLIEGQDISKAISEQLAENFIGTFYGSVTIHFEVLPERKVLRFNVG